MKIISKIFLTGVVVLGLGSACNKLHETLYSEILQDNFFKTQEEAISAIAPVYGNMRSFVNDTWQLSTHCTDETLVAEKALGHWYGEDWPLLNSHKWTTLDIRCNNAWADNYRLVNSANKILYQLESVPNMDPELLSLFDAELKMIRGFGYYNLIDLFGNIPLVTDWKVAEAIPPTIPRSEVFNFIVKDIESNVELLSDKVDGSTHGRFNKYAGYALLAKFYLNAEVWTGVPQWNKVIEYCNKIIESGKYSITANYFDNFIIKNNGSKENILIIPFNEVYTPWGNTIPWIFLHYAQSEQFGLLMVPWNGSSAVPSFIHSFDITDKRLKGWLYGQQFSATGDSLFCNQESAGNPLNLTIDYINIFNPDDHFAYNPSFALEFMGARFAKYEYGAFLSTAVNDFVIYRYADILIMKAEALMRQSGGIATSDVVDLVNLVRSRAFNDPSKLYTTGTLTMDALLAERGWEFYCEGMRRNDMVRFGKFIKGTWEFYDRSDEDATRNLFPIPQSQINVNPNLVQNPGY